MAVLDPAHTETQMTKIRYVLAQIIINKVHEVLAQNTRENLMWTRTKTRLGEAQITKNKGKCELAQNHNKKTRTR